MPRLRVTALNRFLSWSPLPPQSRRTHVVASFKVGQSRFCAGLLTDTGSRSGTLPARWIRQLSAGQQRLSSRDEGKNPGRARTTASCICSAPLISDSYVLAQITMSAE